MTRGLARAAVGIAFAMAGCNVVFSLDPTTAADPNNPFDPRDHDLDGYNNFTDNCPTLANAQQSDRDSDSVGDVCDPHPDAAGDQIAERTFFADPEAELDRWDTNNFRFEPGAAVYDGRDTATLNSKRTYEQPRMVVELGFEVIAWNVMIFGGGTGIVFDDIGGPWALLRNEDTHMALRLVGPGVPEGSAAFFTPLIDTGVPIRMLAAFDRTSLELTGTVGAIERRDVTTSTLVPGPFKLTTVEVAMRVAFIVVYVSD